MIQRRQSPPRSSVLVSFVIALIMFVFAVVGLATAKSPNLLLIDGCLVALSLVLLVLSGRKLRP